MQGYNAQAVCNEQQIVVAAEVSVSSADFGQMGPMIAHAETELARAGITAAPTVVLADAGYWHGEQIDELMGRGIQVLVPPDASKRKGTRPGWHGGRYAFMRRVLATETGGDLYRKRQQLIEPVFADTKFNRGIDRFQRRGRSAARSEWRLITASGNLMKLHRHQLRLAELLNEPPGVGTCPAAADTTGTHTADDHVAASSRPTRHHRPSAPFRDSLHAPEQPGGGPAEFRFRVGGASRHARA